MLAEFGIEFLGRAGIGKGGGQSRVLVGFRQSGDDVNTNCLVIHLGHCDEHSAAGKKRHEFNEHRTSFVAHVLTFSSATCVVNWEED